MLLTDIQKENFEISEMLISLWCEVFGDEKEYAELILPFLSSFDCFAHFENKKIVSAFYLLPSEIKIENFCFNGKYLYAAATKNEFRGRGLMGGLIEEAKEYCKSRNEFISLVPASESLYDYYSRFGFKTSMATSVTEKTIKSDTLKKISDIDYISKFRRNSFEKIHYFKNEAMNYALNCYSFSGTFYYETLRGIALYNEADNELIEYIDKSERLKLTEKCGMIYTENEYLSKISDIYNNLTLA